MNLSNNQPAKITTVTQQANELKTSPYNTYVLLSIHPMMRDHIFIILMKFKIQKKLNFKKNLIVDLFYLRLYLALLRVFYMPVSVVISL